MTAATLNRIARSFGGFAEQVGFGAIRTERDYDKALQLVEAIMDATRGKRERESRANPLNALLSFLVPAIEAYEANHHPVPALTGAEFLRSLMDEQGLKQGDLPEVGNQSVVSQILAGKRKLNARQISALARRFKVPADAFLA